MNLDVPRKHIVAYRAVVEKKAPMGECVRIFCIQCCGWDEEEASRCTATTCPLHRFKPKLDNEKKV